MINICFAIDVYKCLTNPVMPLVSPGLIPVSFLTITDNAPSLTYGAFDTNPRCIIAT